MFVCNINCFHHLLEIFKEKKIVEFCWHKKVCSPVYFFSLWNHEIFSKKCVLKDLPRKKHFPCYFVNFNIFFFSWAKISKRSIHLIEFIQRSECKKYLWKKIKKKKVLCLYHVNVYEINIKHIHLKEFNKKNKRLNHLFLPLSNFKWCYFEINIGNNCS